MGKKPVWVGVWLDEKPKLGRDLKAGKGRGILAYILV
jgi:hypothetical protein